MNAVKQNPLARKPTLEFRAAEYKRKLTTHLEAVRALMQTMALEGFTVNFNISQPPPGGEYGLTGPTLIKTF